jgi:GT2 family glycosyltransferase
VRRNLFLKLKGFDERFFVYFEEVDFSYRSRKEGWYSAYFSGAEAFHKGGGSSDQVKAARIFYSTRSRIQYVFKHFNVPSVVLVLFITLVVEPVTRSVFFLLKGSIVSFKENLIAYRMLFSWLLRYRDGDRK